MERAGALGKMTCLTGDFVRNKKGIWPNQLPFGAEAMLAVPATHAKANGRLSWNFVLNAFVRLEVARQTH